jgi:CRISPR system Cascade subunit CasA
VPTFNLIHELWIRCVRLDGQARDVGLADVLASAHEISEITDESPLVAAALHRLLLAILHRNLGPRDTETWGQLWRQGSFSAKELEAYWTRWESHFDLFHDSHPFYQSATITESDGPRSAGILEFHRSSGNNATLADHTTDERSPAMTPAGAARALVACQTFALGGTVGYLKSCEKDADKRASDAPSARGAICLLRGASLFQTLMLNLAEYDPVSHPEDLPCWERTPSQGKGERTPNGRVDLLTWQSRRSRLFYSQLSEGSAQVDQVKLVPGFRAPLMWNPFRDESMQSYVLKREAKPGERPWFQYRITPERAVWRDSSAIIHGIEGEKRRTLTIDWIAQLDADGELPRGFTCRLEVLGFATDQQKQKIELWRREQLPIAAGLVRDQRCKELLRSALRHADDTGAALTSATVTLADKILAPQLDQDKSKADPRRVKELARSFGAEIQYWSSLGTPFQEFLESLAESQRLTDEDLRDSASNAGFDVWKTLVRTSVLDAFNRASSGVTQNVRGLRAQAIAETELRRRLATVARKLLGGDDAAGKTK